MNNYDSLEGLDITEQMLLFYRDHLDIFIEDAFPPIKLTRSQHVMVRQIGRKSQSQIVANRGYGKSFITALSALGLGCLYPGTPVAVCSYTAVQAKIILQKLRTLAQQNPNIANEIQPSNTHTLVRLSKDKGQCILKNGSSITSYATDSLRGHRAKVVILDQQREMDRKVIASVISPLKNFKRSNAINGNFKDFDSKTIGLTSATQQGTQFYDNFLRVVKNTPKDYTGCFAMSIDWRTAVSEGITDQQYFMKQRDSLPEIQFQIQYGSKFLGSCSGSAFPFALTGSCRTLQKVQTSQPKNSKSRYALALDIATSEDRKADNSIISIIKFNERSDGSFSKKLIYMRSFHGVGLDVLAQQVRILYHVKFPNIQRIIYDARGLGDSFPKFLDDVWVDKTTGKQYPPLIQDDMPRFNSDAIPVLHPVRAIQSLNQRIATNLRVALQKHTLQLPITSRILQAKMHQENTTIKMQQRAIYYEIDALQVQMGNVVPKVSQYGNVIYDCKHSQHKDRYSSLAYCNDYIAQMEKSNMNKRRKGPYCIGITSTFTPKKF